MEIFIILGIPVLLAVSTFAAKKIRAYGIINACGYSITLFAAFSLLCKANLNLTPGKILNFFYLDTLSVFFLFVVSIISFAAALYSISYISKDMESGVLSPVKAKVYYLFFNLFSCSMFFVPAVNNLGMMWVGIEMTTLISAFLVGFYNTKRSVEAAWKYIIICSLGIILALLGTMLFYYAFSVSGAEKSLNWTDMFSVSVIPEQRNLIKIAFIFILIGYGTKAGLAPMHTWLPDAHSQAVAPISALLSGVLLKTALYAILRFGIIVNKNLGFQYFGNLLLLFGLISLGVSCGLILVQKDLKRLLAYSSIEHVGIISVGFGLGSPLALWGAFMHIFNHAVTKSLMFFGAGNIVVKYKRHNMNTIKGVIGSMPFSGIMVLLGVFALTGFPPFSIFISEILIIAGAFLKGSYLIAALLLFFVVVIFAGIIYHFGGMLFGSAPKEMRPSAEPLSSKTAFIFLLFQICLFGILLPFIFKGAFVSLVALIKGS